jgi:haloalkane dehalogenase
MHRRQFMAAAAGGIVAGALGACVSSSSRPVKATDAAAWSAARRFAPLRFGRIAYVERGSGDAALFLHGFPLSSFQWRGAFDRLSGERRCVAADFLGLGFTEVAPGQSCAPSAQVEMLAALLDSLSIPAVDLIANDSGGAVAQLFVLRYPQRVRTMLLTNCDVEPDSPPPALQPVLAAAREGKFAETWLAPSVANKSLARTKEGLGGQTFTYPENPTDEAIDQYLAPLVSSPERRKLTDSYALALDPNPLAGIEAALKRCTVPTRIIWGTGDPIFSKDSADYLDRTLPNSRGVRRIPGAKLFFPEEFPDIIAEEARLLRDFFLVLFRNGHERGDAELRLADVAEHGRAAQAVVLDANRHARQHIAPELLDELAVARAELQLPIARHGDRCPGRREALDLLGAGEVLATHAREELLLAVVG